MSDDKQMLCNFCCMGLMPLTIGLVFLTLGLTFRKKVISHVSGYTNYQNDDSCYSGYPIFTVVHNNKNYTGCSIAYYGNMCGCGNVDSINTCLHTVYPIDYAKIFYVDPNNYDACDNKQDSQLMVITGVLFMMIWLVGMFSLINTWLKIKPPEDRQILISTMEEA